MKGIYLKQLAVGPMHNFAYLVGPAAGPECAVVDPGWDASAILSAARQDGRRITVVLLSHNHYDHLGAIKNDMLENGGASLYVHQDDAAPLAAIPRLHLVRDGDCLRMGLLEFRFLHTPGHTPGSQCVLAVPSGKGEQPPFKDGGPWPADDQLFTGDTLFMKTCGRTDLEGSQPEAMHRSLRRLAAMPRQTVVWPGHDYGGPSASLSEVLKMNPFLAAASLKEFLRLGA